MIRIKVVENKKKTVELTVADVKLVEPFIFKRDWIDFESSDDDIDAEIDGTVSNIYIRAQGSNLSKVPASKVLVINIANGYISTVDKNDCIVFVDIDINLSVID